MTDYLKNDNLILFNLYKEIEYNFKLIINPNDNAEKIIQNKSFLFFEDYGSYKKLHKPKEFKTHYIGFTTIEFLNNYDFIINLCEKYENEIKNSNDELIISVDDLGIVDCEIECQDMLDNFMEELNKNNDIIHCVPFLINDIYCFRHNFFIQVRNYTKELERIISEGKQQLNINKNSELTNRITILETQLKELTEKATFYKNKCINFITDYKKKLYNLYNMFTDTFIPEYQDYKDISCGKIKRQNKYKNDNIDLPKANIKLNKDNKKKITEYCYTISSLEELGTISLYHIMLMGKRVIPCSYCKNYFIPNNKEIYCDRLQRYVTIQQTKTDSPNNKNIEQIEIIKEVRTKDNDLIIKKIYEKDKVTKETELKKIEKTENKENLIPKDTMITQFDTGKDKQKNSQIIKNENLTIKLIKNSCKDLGKRQTYINNNSSNCDLLYKALRDRINNRIKNCKKKNNENELKIFEQEKSKFHKIYNDVLDMYDSPDEKFYHKLHIELTKFDYKYIKEHPPTFKPYTSYYLWEETTKNELLCNPPKKQ